MLFDLSDVRLPEALKEVLFEELVARMGREAFRH
jgi:hypothetical protein